MHLNYMKRYSDWLLFTVTLNIAYSATAHSLVQFAVSTRRCALSPWLSISVVSFMSKECVQQACLFSPFCLGMCEWTDCPGQGIDITPQPQITTHLRCQLQETRSSHLQNISTLQAKTSLSKGHIPANTVHSTVGKHGRRLKMSISPRMQFLITFSRMVIQVSLPHISLGLLLKRQMEKYILPLSTCFCVLCFDTWAISTMVVLISWTCASMEL